MMNEKPIEAARRNNRRLEQGRCLLCGRTGVLIQLDHSAGQNHDDFLKAPLCVPCHAMVTELRRRADADPRSQRTSVARVKYALKSTGVFLNLLAEAMFRWANLLSESENQP
jgi:hypothetical protein